MLVPALVATLAVSAGCGIPRQDEPTALAPDAVPFGLLEQTTTTTSSTVPADPSQVSAVQLYFLDNDRRLREVRREIAGEANLRRALEELLEGPTEAESRFGLVSSIVDGVTLRSVTAPDDGVVTIDLGGNLGGVSGEALRAAYAQLVYTATARPAVRRVLFRLNGEQQDVPDADGELTSEPVSRADYRQLDFEAQATSTTAPPPVDDG